MLAIALALTLAAQDRPTAFREFVAPPQNVGLNHTGFGWAAATRRDGFDRYDVFRSPDGQRVVLRRQTQQGEISWAGNDSCPSVDAVMAAYAQLSFGFDITPPPTDDPVSIAPTDYLRWVWWKDATTRDLMVEATEGSVKDFVDRAVSDLRDCWAASAPTP